MKRFYVVRSFYHSTGCDFQATQSYGFFVQPSRMRSHFNHFRDFSFTIF